MTTPDAFDGCVRALLEYEREQQKDVENARAEFEAARVKRQSRLALDNARKL